MTAITLQDIGEFVLLDDKKGEDGYVLLSVKYDNGKRLQAEILDRKYCSIGWYDVKYVSSLQQNGTKDV